MRMMAAAALLALLPWQPQAARLAACLLRGGHLRPQPRQHLLACTRHAREGQQQQQQQELELAFMRTEM